jgi:hypothetical protein
MEDTRLAAERGVKNAYSVNGHTCDEDADGDSPGPVPPKPGTGNQGHDGTGKPQ